MRIVRTRIPSSCFLFVEQPTSLPQRTAMLATNCLTAKPELLRSLINARYMPKTIG